MPSHPDSPLEKASLRRHLRTKRGALSVEERQVKSAKILARAMALPPYISGHKIAGYYPMGTEVDCTPILSLALAQKKKVYLPVISNVHPKMLQFSPYVSTDLALLHKNALGVFEPPFNPETVITSDHLSLAFVPLVGFDAMGSRLGTGGGYYDVTFQKRTCVLVGLAFDCQEVPVLPKDIWDVPMDYILTESRTIQCS